MKSSNAESSEQKKKPVQKIPGSIKECEKLVKDLFKNSDDVVTMTFDTNKEKAMIVYIEGLINKDLIDRDILLPLKSDSFSGDVKQEIKVTEYQAVDTVDEFTKNLLEGHTAIFYGDSKKVIMVDILFWIGRPVTPPDAEAVIRGPKEGFVECLKVNMAMVRRKIRDTGLVMEKRFLGRRTKTCVVISYIEGVANNDVLNELRKRLSKIDCDAILDSGYIEQYIEDQPLSPISTVGVTQKPDKLAAMLLEGRIAILCDGTPHALYVPHLFVENIITSDDYYNRTISSSLMRVIRFIAMLLTIILPGFYVAMVSFNQEMIPDQFLLTLAVARERVPLPVGAEMFFTLLMFEFLRESGIRLPRTVGSAISIVGALIIGESTVTAGIVGAPVIIILGITAITSFIVPSIMEFAVVYRFLFLILGGTMGLIGVGSGILIMLTQLASTRSFGVPILSSFSRQELKDTLVRFPLKALRKRPKSVAGDGKIRNRTT